MPVFPKHSFRILIAAGALMAAVYAVPALSDAHNSMQGMDMPAAAVTDVYAPAMQSMHHAMMVKPTGDADIDFMREMIPHHQGAIDMAKIALEHAKDPEVRKMAQDIITAQEKEIAFMHDWLKRHGAEAK